ncbi:MAG: fumarylacetoacetate hydrolase family protein [Deltaproteobacteria bacterium]|nr:fumarylacetoacetate hydrolase family protein [Deltaproteobacteria bacterium]
MTDRQLSQAATRLLEAYKDQKPIDPLTEEFPDLTTEEAYRIQLLTIRSRVADGGKIVGKKIGLTSPAMQQMFNVGEPDYGHLLDDMLGYQGFGLSAAKLLQPRVEGEIAFILKKGIKGPGVTPTDVLRATAGVTAALEIIDSRIRDWKIKIQDTVADNASSGAFVLGARMLPVNDIDLRHVGFVLSKNGQTVGTGAGAAVLGSPAQSVAWLANRLAAFGIGLEPGEIILSGSAVAAVPVKSGDSVHLVVDRIGEVGCFFG